MGLEFKCSVFEPPLYLSNLFMTVSCYLTILCSNCLACLQVLRHARQKQWLQLGMMPNLASDFGFSMMTSMQMPQVLSLERATAKDKSMSASNWLMQDWNKNKYARFRSQHAKRLNLRYSNHLNTGLVRYSNGQKLSSLQMVWFSNGIWIGHFDLFGLSVEYLVMFFCSVLWIWSTDPV